MTMNTNKKSELLLIILAVVLAIALPFAVMAATSEVTFTSWFTSTDTGDATGTTGASTISAHGGTVAFPGATPVVDFYSVTADNAANRLYIMTESTTSTALSQNDAAGTTLHVNGTVGFAANDYVAVQDNSAQKFEVNKVSAAGVGTLTVARTTANAYTAGAKVTKLSNLYSLPVGAATVTTSAKLAGKQGQVMGWHLDGSVAARISDITGHYEK
jgi:hypothetical protein